MCFENKPTTQYNPICLLPRGKVHSSTDRIREHVPAKSRNINIFFPEYETRTDIRVRVRGIVIRIRIRNTAIRIRVVIGARQNKGRRNSTCILTLHLHFYVYITNVIRFFGDSLIYTRNMGKMPGIFPKIDRLTPVLTSKHLQCFERTYALRFADNAPESETRTDIRARVRGIAIRIRKRNTAIRIRVANGARQNKGSAR